MLKIFYLFLFVDAAIELLFVVPNVILAISIVNVVPTALAIPIWRATMVNVIQQMHSHCHVQKTGMLCDIIF